MALPNQRGMENQMERSLQPNDAPENVGWEPMPISQIGGMCSNEGSSDLNPNSSEIMGNGIMNDADPPSVASCILVNQGDQ